MTETDDPLLRRVAAVAAEEESGPGADAPPLSAQRREQMVQAALRVVRVPSRVRRPLTLGAVLLTPLALAAGFLVLLRPSRPEPLPPFALEASGGNERARGAPEAAGPLALLPDAPVEVVLRPPVAVAGVGVRAFLSGAGGWSEISVAPAVSEAGVMRVRGRAGALFADRRGAFVLHLLVGRSAVLEDAERLVRLGETQGPGWQRLSIPLQLLPGP
jgi:hypothetical protein